MAEVKRIPSGIPGLDFLIENGFPNINSWILLSGPSGVGKSIFCEQFLWKGIKEGDACVYVTLSHPPEKIREQMKSFGWDITTFERDNRFFIFDGYYGKESIERFHISDASKPELVFKEANELFQKLLDTLRERRVRIVLDSITLALAKTGFEPMMRFMKGFRSQFSGYPITMIHIANIEGMFYTQLEATLTPIMDGIIEMFFASRGDRLLRFLRVRKMEFTRHATEEVPFWVTKYGIIIGEPDERLGELIVTIKNEPSVLAQILGVLHKYNVVALEGLSNNIRQNGRREISLFINVSKTTKHIIEIKDELENLPAVYEAKFWTSSTNSIAGKNPYYKK